MGSPPPATSKKDVLRCRSVNNLVTTPANTGNENRSNTEVTSILQVYLGILLKATVRLLHIVAMKLSALRIDEIPIKCMLTIRKSTAAVQ